MLLIDVHYSPTEVSHDAYIFGRSPLVTTKSETLFISKLVVETYNVKKIIYNIQWKRPPSVCILSLIHI